MIDKEYPKVNFIGNKRKITDWIFKNIPEDVDSFFDAFSGGCSVSFEAKKRGYKVISNDILKINYHIAKALIENKNTTLSEEDVNTIFSGKPFKGFMYKNYSKVFYFPKECKRLDRYRENVKKLKSPYKRSLALALLRRSMIRKMPYSRFSLSWDRIKQLRDEEYSYRKYKRRRAYHNETFKKHFLANLEDYNEAVFDNKKKNKAYNKDIFKLIPNVDADLVYLDPPYTGSMNNYFRFYSLLDNYVLSKKTEPFENDFIDKESALELFKKLFSKLGKYKYWVLSYNNSSYPPKEELKKTLEEFSKNVEIIGKKHNYKMTGKKNKNKNREYLFIVKNKNA